MTIVRVGEIAEQVRGVSYAKPDASAQATDDSIPLLRANNVTDHGLTFDDLIHVKSPNVSQKQMLRVGDIVVAASSGSLSVVGKAAQIREPFRGTFGAFCKVVRPSNLVDARYLGHFFRTRDYRTRISSLAAGANINNLKNEHIDELEIPLPPLDEQRQIAAILDQADALRRMRRTAIKRTRSLERAIFDELFGAPDTNRKRLPLVEFGRLISEGPTNGLYKPSSDYGDGSPILRIGDFYDGRLVDLDQLRRLRATPKELTTYALSKGDVVINRVNSREYLGKSALVPLLKEPTVFESNMMRVRLNLCQIDPVYCVSFLQLPFIKRQILQKTKDAINQSSINQKDVGSLIIMLPPLDEQRRFGRILTAIETQVSQETSHLTALDTLFASLQYRAFNGELTAKVAERELAEVS